VLPWKNTIFLLDDLYCGIFSQSKNCEASGSINTLVARQGVSSRHAKAQQTHATIEELLEAAFSVRSVPRLYNEDQLP
jgi:hypothetical protein